jgi:DNA-binding MarR family transcriptional regulator
MVEDFLRIARKIATECPALRARELSRLLTRIYDAALRPIGIQSSQLSVLVAVAMFGERGARFGPLADCLLMDRTTLTRNVRPIERAGVIRVSRDASDARVRVVTLTKAGERTLEAAYPLWEQARQEARRYFGAGQMDELRDHIDRLIENASPADDDAGR